jgi:Fic family protein
VTHADLLSTADRIAATYSEEVCERIRFAMVEAGRNACVSLDAAAFNGTRAELDTKAARKERHKSARKQLSAKQQLEVVRGLLRDRGGEWTTRGIHVATSMRESTALRHLEWLVSNGAAYKTDTGGVVTYSASTPAPLVIDGEGT